MENLKTAQETMQHCREQMKAPYAVFDIAERISLKGCRLEDGKLIGSEEEAARIAGMWIQDFHKDRGNVFAYEVGIYILFLLHRNVDYGFQAGREG